MKTMSRKLMTVFIIASMFMVPVYAKPGNGPKYDKYVASLEIEETRYGQVVFNTNPEYAIKIHLFLFLTKLSS